MLSCWNKISNRSKRINQNLNSKEIYRDQTIIQWNVMDIVTKLLLRMNNRLKVGMKLILEMLGGLTDDEMRENFT